MSLQDTSICHPSELAAKALRLTPTGRPLQGHDTHCAMCQRAIHEGDLAEPLKLSQSFTDFVHLRPGSEHVCGWCSTTMPQQAMRALQRSCITGDGIYNLNTDAARAWFWLTPPDPPYVLVINHSVMATFHYYWRTPVTLSNELVAMNLDGKVHSVRRARVIAAIGQAKVLIDASQRHADKKNKPIKSPFRMLARQPAKGDSAHGVLNPRVATLRALEPECEVAASALQELNPGELAALSAMVKAAPAEPVQPELTTSL